MHKNEPIKKIMSTRLITGTVNDVFSDIAKKMEKNAIHHLPIVSGKELVGMISQIDLLRVSFSNVFVPSDKSTTESMDHTIVIKNIMQKDLITIKETDTVRHATEILSKSEYNSLPIVDDHNHLTGIVTSKDLIRYLLDQY